MHTRLRKYIRTLSKFHAHRILTLILTKNSSGGKPSHSSIQHSRADSFIPRREGMVLKNGMYLYSTSPANTVSQNQQHRSNGSRRVYTFTAWCKQSALHVCLAFKPVETLKRRWFSTYTFLKSSPADLMTPQTRPRCTVLKSTRQS